MEKQNDLVVEVLKRLSQKGILDRILLIGSWAAYFYKFYFKNENYHPVLKTRDIDFLLPRPIRFPQKVDLELLLSDLGFDIAHASNGYMKLESAELILEMLIPEIGAGSDKPYPIPELNFNAQPLRHLSMLWREPIKVKIEEVVVKVPHPADYVLHKMIIQEKRSTKEKKEKDIQSALSVLETLWEMKKQKTLKPTFQSLSKKERGSIFKVLEENGKVEVLEFLRSLN